MTAADKNSVLNEIVETETVIDLCVGTGKLNPEVKGWSRFPVQRCNLSGHFTRKKRWNRWYISGKKCVFTISICDIDYMGLVFASLFDTESGQTSEKCVRIPFAENIYLGETVDSCASFQNDNLDVQFMKEGEDFSISLAWMDFSKGKDLCAELMITAPKKREILNVAVPGKKNGRFRFTSKQNGLAARGFLSLGAKRFDVAQEESRVFSDFSRGIFPVLSAWNCGSFSGRSGRDLVGFNTARSGMDDPEMTENAVWVNGKIHKIPEQILFCRESGQKMSSWTLHAESGDAVDLVFTPSTECSSVFGGGLASYSARQLFGKYRGTVKTGRRRLEIKDLPGWCEEHSARW